MALEWLGRLAGRLGGRDGTEEPSDGGSGADASAVDGSTPRNPTTDEPAVDAGNAGDGRLFPPGCTSRTDIAVETGRPPEDHLVAALEAADGCLRQQRVVELTGWSQGQVSRFLSDLESEDEITRVRVGVQKLVCLQGAQPEDVADPGETGDRSEAFSSGDGEA